MVSICTRCDIVFRELVKKLRDFQSIRTLLSEHGMIRTVTKCELCQKELTVEETWLFRCDNTIEEMEECTQNKVRCQFELDARIGTLFENSHLPISAVLQLTYWWVVSLGNVNTLTRELRLSKETVLEWINLFREIAVYYCYNYRKKVGGEDHTVDVNETKFGKRQYVRGGINISGKWVVGGIDRETKHVFFVPIPDNSESTLKAVIQEWVEPGTTVITDSHSLYRDITLEGYDRQTTKRSKIAVISSEADSLKDAKGANPEVAVGAVKPERKTESNAGILAESLYKSAFTENGERFHRFLLMIGEVYPLP